MSTGGNGLFIGAPGSIGPAIARSDRLRAEEKQAQQDQAAADFVRSMLMRGTPAAGTGTPAARSFQVNGRTIGQDTAAGADVSQTPVQLLGMQRAMGPAFNNALMTAGAQQALEQLFSQEVKPMALGEKERLIDTRTGRVILDAAQQAPEPVRGVTMGNRLVDPVTGRVITQFAPEQAEGWRVVSPERARQLNLNPSGVYQENANGQIQVVTQPKQDRATQGENTSAYHARRLATGLTSLSDILKVNPQAATTAAPGNNLISKTLRSDASNRVQAILPEIGDALLTLGTGAAYTAEQFKNLWQANLPALGDSDQVLADKFGRIEALYNQARQNAGPLADQLPDISSIAALYQARASGTQTPTQGEWSIRPRGR